MQKLIALLGFALLAAGCESMATMQIHNQTDVKLTEGNFMTVKTNVVGEAKGFSLFGFITMVPARFQTAMDQLYSKAEVTTGKPQVLGNITMEKTSANWILFSVPRISVRADVVEFVPPSAAIIIPHLPQDHESPPSDDSVPPDRDKSPTGKQL